MERRERVAKLKKLLEKEGLNNKYEVATFCHEPVLKYVQENGEVKITFLPQAWEAVEHTVANIKAANSDNERSL